MERLFRCKNRLSVFDCCMMFSANSIVWSNIQLMVLNSKSTAVFAGDYYTDEIPTATSECLWGRGTQWGYIRKVRCNDVETGSEIFKISAAKPDLLVSQLIYKMAKKVQRLSTCFL